jgi:SAM-dependent methyltransferase
MNRDLWDEWAHLHYRNKNKEYPILDFVDEKWAPAIDGLEFMGDLAGRKLLDLQCHIGVFSICFARLGAIVTGVDFSTVAIRYAKQLATESRVDVAFRALDVLQVGTAFQDHFEIAYSSYGSLIWLHDLLGWAKSVHLTLKNGGWFIINDSHPSKRLYAASRVDALGAPIELPYFRRSFPVAVEERGTYALPDAECVAIAQYWPFCFGDLINALVNAGFVIVSLSEYGDYPEDTTTVPKQFTLIARK